MFLIFMYRSTNPRAVKMYMQIASQWGILLGILINVISSVYFCLKSKSKS